MNDKTVAIELPSGALAGWPVLLDALRKARELTGYLLIFGDLIEQIERQTSPPKPEEPTGLGAVIATEGAGDFIRISCELHNPWMSVQTGLRHHWNQVTAVRVLSEGVGA